MSASQTLQWLAAALDAAAIPYMVVGSFASSAYGQPRTTRDLDVVIDPEPAGLDQFLSKLDLDRCYVDLDVARDALRRRTMFNIIDSSSGWKVDLVVRKDAPHAIEEFRRRTPGSILGVAVHIATAEDVIIAKLGWARMSGSERQLDDVRGILATQADRLDHAYLDGWVATLSLAEMWERARATTG